jgi:type VI protein secretion system component VasF
MAANENRLFTLDIASEERQRRFIPQRYGGNYSLLVLCLLVIFLGAAMLAWRDTTEFVDRAVAVFFYLTLLVGFRGTTRNPERNAIASLIVLPLCSTFLPRYSTASLLTRLISRFVHSW